MATATTTREIHAVNQLDDRSYTLHFRVKRETIYAQRRASFFENIHVLAMFCALLGGSASIVTVLELLPMWVGSVGGVVVTVAIGMDLITRPTLKYCYYQSRVDALSELNGDLLPLRNFSNQEIDELSSRYDKIFHSNMPPTKDLLSYQCHYAALRSFGGKRDQMAHFGWWPRMTAQIFSWADYAQNAAPDPQHPVALQQPHSAAG